MSLGCVYNNGICNRLSQRSKLNRLNERDLSLPVSISQNWIPGIDLNAVLFNQYGYVLNSTNVLKDVLDGGLRRLYLDVFWDTLGNRWHLCPQRPPPNGPSRTNATSHTSTGTLVFTTPSSPPTHALTKSSYWEETIRNLTRPEREGPDDIYQLQDDIQCDYRLDFEEFLSGIRSYIDLSDTNIAASLIVLHLRPKLWSDPPKNATLNATLVSQIGQPSLNKTLGTVIGDRILTPNAVSSSARQSRKAQKEGKDFIASDDWPTLKTVLYTNTARLVVTFDANLNYTIADLDTLPSVAFPMNPTITNPASYSVSALSRLNFTDTFTYTVADWEDARRAGVSPVLASDQLDVYSNTLIEMLESHMYWPWATKQPILYTTEQREQMLSNGYKDDAKLAACAVYSRAGMEVANCYSHFPVLCKNKNNRYDWSVSPDNHTYFSPDCPKNYEFATPANPLEARLIRELEDFDTKNAWVDFNSLYLPNCWVTGGTNAVCPYNIRQDGRNGIGFIAAAAAISFFALLFIFLFEWDRGKSPLIRTNLKRNKTRKPEFEGVPS